MKENYVLYGIVQTAPQYNGRIYDEEVFKKALDEYNRKELYRRRKRIVDKLLKESWMK